MATDLNPSPSEQGRAATDRRTALLRLPDLTPEVVGAWRDLAGRAAEANPFAEPETVLPAMRHLADRGHAGLLTVARGARLEAVLPVTWPVRVPLGEGRSVPVPVLQTWVEPFQQLGAPLLDRDAAVPAMAALLRPGTVPGIPALLMRYFPENGPVAAALDAALAQRGQRAVRLKTYERALLLREGGPAVKSNRRRRYTKLRESMDAMAADLGPVQLVDRSDDPAAVEDFLRLEAAGWKGARGTALASRAAHAAWFREVCDGLRAAGRLELPVLSVGDRVAAIACNLVAGDGRIHLRSAYDEDLGDYRPGAQLVRHWAETMGESHAAWFDSLTVPDNELFNQLWPARRTLSTVVVPYGPGGRTATALARRAAEWRARRAGA
ncbi:GNAT family N-acetyltransferase [Blastococcus sp. TF02A-35]|uniref:GNAT family N-acetyltransferase n=1 Tax=Blastococcus sp. TF02A-35 TaxID=2559612 RepID=UPI001073D320|nr:GNAT family N-acetyltransferase [Blastococcus sp. TF02A_35]TFV53694.1 GNAT family N-acetyltransferase [Blastococcus sp. TF02A_35]